MLPGESDLGTQIGNFFRALNDLAAAPSDLAPRAVAIESGNSLAEAFNSTAVQLEQLKKATLDRTSEAITSLNTITKELASVNDKILSASQSGRSPNSLLDLRDKLIGEISKLADVTALLILIEVLRTSLSVLLGLVRALFQAPNRRTLVLLSGMTRLVAFRLFLIRWHQKRQQANSRPVR